MKNSAKPSDPPIGVPLRGYGLECWALFARLYSFADDSLLVLAGVCRWLERWDAAMREVEANGPVIDDRFGQPKENPALQAAGRCWSEALKGATHLGINLEPLRAGPAIGEVMMPTNRRYQSPARRCDSATDAAARSILSTGRWWEWWETLDGRHHGGGDEPGRLRAKPFISFRWRSDPDQVPADLDDLLRAAWPELRDELTDEAAALGRVPWGVRYDPPTEE
ncbi:MAG: P27 family phage terminase small subunit [Planctomycetia bacterium]|nr:P27 family phage terminase small subunit [Planctomycetia bacterium]